MLTELENKFIGANRNSFTAIYNEKLFEANNSFCKILLAWGTVHM